MVAHVKANASPGLKKRGTMRRIAAGIALMIFAGAPAFAQTSVSVAVRHAMRAVGTHDVLPATAQGLVIGTSTQVIGRLGAWGSFTTWPVSTSLEK